MAIREESRWRGRWERRALRWAVSLALGGAIAFVWLEARSRSEASAEPALQLELFKSEGVRWIEQERDRHRDSAEPIEGLEREILSAYFSDSLLDLARVRVVDRIENPDFYSVFDEAGEPYPIDLRHAAGVALLDTVLLARGSARGPGRLRLLFHELVHLVQVDVLGLDDYMNRYVEGWAATGSYRSIPHERQAYDLAARFREDPAKAFRVESEVRDLFSVPEESGLEPGNSSPEEPPR